MRGRRANSQFSLLTSSLLFTGDSRHLLQGHSPTLLQGHSPTLFQALPPYFVTGTKYQPPLYWVIQWLALSLQIANWEINIPIKQFCLDATLLI